MRFKKHSIVIFLSIFMFASGQSYADNKNAQAFFVDILYLKNGKTVAEARKYFEAVEPIIAVHGLKRANLGFEIVDAMQGDKEMDLVNIWTVADPKTTFKKIFSDPAYKKYIATRDSIFDMENSMMFLAQDAKF